MSIALRKLMLRRRGDLFHRNDAFELLWEQVFPKHDPVTLRLKRPPNRAEAFWDQSWAEAARAYHASRQKFKAIA
jgi:hypothetical protein